jgi:hypothetical protein
VWWLPFSISAFYTNREVSPISKQSGLGWTTFSVDDAAGSPEAIINDITNFQFATPRAVQDITGVDKFAMERLLLLADASVTMNGVANFASSPSAHDVFKTIPLSTSPSRTVTMTIASKTLPLELLLTDYPLTRSAAGELTFAVPGVLSNGVVPTWA